MRLSEFGERNLVEMARRIFRKGGRIVVGIGDDAAAIEINGKCIVATTDMLVQSTHFPEGTSPRLMGRKSVAVNLSDLAAMGARPLGLIFSVGLRRDLDVRFAREMIIGMNESAARYGTFVVGGDIDESDEVVISGSAFGICDRKNLMRRSGARPGDVLAVTGYVGNASAGLDVIKKEGNMKKHVLLVRSLFDPVPRVREGTALAESGTVTAAIDISDSLASNLWQISRESGVKITLDVERVPIHPALERYGRETGKDPLEFALFGGEDLELLVTVRQDKLRKARAVLAGCQTPLTAIGKVERGRGVFAVRNGKAEKLPDRGYEHFR
ncbi:MAG: thiamine-phosphate kinase [Candidatus Hadarchaeales archaeon]